MEQNNYNSVHIMSEAVIVGGITMFFYKKISDLESTLEELKSTLYMQNNQIKFLLGLINPSTISQARGLTPHAESVRLSFGQSPKLTTPLTLPPQHSQIQPQKEYFSNLSQHEPPQTKGSPYNCEGGVCKLKNGPKDPEVVKASDLGLNEALEKKVVSISKISKQIEYDRENMDLDQTAKVKTYTDFSPNPVLKSYNPKTRESGPD
jgi:hypothetical protein